MKDKIIIWTPEEPQGYGVCDQDEDHSSLPDDTESEDNIIKIIYDEEEEGFVCR